MDEIILTMSFKGEYREKGSTFTASAVPAISIGDIKSKLENLKDKYPDASIFAMPTA